MVVRRNLYKGVYLQRGGGFGTVVSTLFRVLVPWLKRGAGAALKSETVRRAVRGSLKAAKSSAVKAAGDATRDLLSGKNPKAGAKLNLSQAKQGIERALDRALLTTKKIAPTRPKAKKVKRVGSLKKKNKRNALPVIKRSVNEPLV